MNTKKGLIALTAIIVLFFFAAMPASAFPFEIYKWEQVNDEGFGDFTNDYAWSMHEYKVGDTNYLYVATLNGNVSAWPPNLTTDGLEIYRSPTGENPWEQVVGPDNVIERQDIIGTPYPPGGIGPATAGFRMFNTGGNSMESCGGLLWVGTFNYMGCQIWVTNGTHWKLANMPGFGNTNSSSARTLACYNNTLYAGTWNMRGPGEGGEVWRYNGSTDFDLINPLEWEQVVDHGFSDPDHNLGIGKLVPFNPPDDGEEQEYLYAGTWAATFGDVYDPDYVPKGCEVWRSPTGDPGSWVQVVGDTVPIGRGFGNLYNDAVMSGTVFEGYLYMGTENFANGSQVWRTSDGTTWEAVTEDGFGRGGILGLVFPGDGGFSVQALGNPPLYMWNMHEYHGELFVGTWSPLLGCEIWKSPSGNPGSFKQANLWGMDFDSNQYGARDFEVFNDELYVGTASFLASLDVNLSAEAGCEIWRTSGETLLPPKIDVNKTVWDPKAGVWVDKLEKAYMGDTVRFRCEVHNNDTSMLTFIQVQDVSSRSLEYAGDATVRYPSGLTLPREPDFAGPLTMMNHTIGTRLTWKFLVPLDPSESITIEYNATVVKSLLDKDINIMSASGYYIETGRLGVGYDYVIVVDPPPDPGPGPGPGPDPVPVQVPALTPIGIMVLVGLLAVVAVGVIRKRQK